MRPPTVFRNFKNFILKKCVSFCSDSNAEQQHDFLVISTTAMGDTLWSTAAIRELKKSFPEQKITVLTSAIGAQVLQNNPHIDEIFIWKGYNFFCLVHALRKRKIGTAILLHASQRTILPLCCLAKIGRRVGTNHRLKGLECLLTDSLPLTYEHEINRRLNLIKLVGGNATNPLMEVFPTDREEKQAQCWIENQNIPPTATLIGIHPGAMQPFRRYPKEHWITLIQNLQKKGSFHFFITGTTAEKNFIHEIQKSVTGCTPVIGALSPLALAVLIRKCSLFISNDTGPLHLAISQTIPTISLYIPTDPNLCGPFLVSSAQVIARSKTCSPCLMKKCLRPFCFYQIPPEKIMECALDILKK